MDSQQPRKVKTVEELAAEERERLKPLRIQNQAGQLNDLVGNLGQGLFLVALGVITMIYGLHSEIDGPIYIGLGMVVSGSLIALYFCRSYRLAVREIEENQYRRK